MNKFQPTREGDVILIVVPNYWGRGKTFGRAAEQVWKAGSTRPTERTKKGKMLVYSAHPKAYCDDVDGTIYSPKGHPPIRLNP